MLLFTAGTLPVGAKCPPGERDVCQRVAGSEVVFIGRVIANTPDYELFARRVGTRDPDSLSLGELRAIAMDAVPEPHRPRVQNAQTSKEVEDALDAAGEGGLLAVMEVDEVFKGSIARQVELRTSTGACGPLFLKGETLVVFAGRDEDGKLSTGMCAGNLPLSHAGAYLPYLHVLKYGGDSTARVFGRVQKFPRGRELTVALERDGVRRTAVTDDSGYFALDRLPAGVYTLSVLDHDELLPLAQPQRFEVTRGACLERNLELR